MVIVEVEGKPEMPNVVWIPKEQTSAMIPMPKKADLKYELFADDDVPTVAELEAQRAKVRAQWEDVEATKKLIEADIAATKAKEATSSSNIGMTGAIEKSLFNVLETTSTPVAKPKPKKRGRGFGSKNKKKG